MGLGPIGGGQKLHQLELNFVRVRLLGEAKPAGEAADVCIHRKGCVPSQVNGDDAGSLSTDSGQRLELCTRHGHKPSVILNQGLRRRDDVLCLASVKSARLDHRLELVGRSFGVGLSSGVSSEQRGCDHVDALVGTLRRENDGDQKLERGPVTELDLRVRHVCIEPIDDRRRPATLFLLRFSHHHRLSHETALNGMEHGGPN